MRNLRWLAEKYSIDLVAFRAEAERNDPVDALRQMCEKIYVEEVNWWTRAMNAALHPLAPFSVAARLSATVNMVIRQWHRACAYERIHVEWTQMGNYLPALMQVPQRTLYVHDVLEQWAARRAARRKLGFLWLAEAARARYWERRHLPKFTRVFTPSAKDCHMALDCSPELSGKVEVLPLHFDRYLPSAPRNFRAPLRILFWGALSRRENADGARWICDCLAPELRKKGEGFTIVIAGSNPPADIVAQRGPQIDVTGFVDAPAEVFARCHLAVLPIFEGAGVKVKLLECLASGLPCITTAVGAEGIEAGLADGMIVLAATARLFADTIASLEADRPRLAMMSAQAESWGKRQQSDHRTILLR